MLAKKRNYDKELAKLQIMLGCHNCRFLDVSKIGFDADCSHDDIPRFVFQSPGNFGCKNRRDPIKTEA